MRQRKRQLVTSMPKSLRGPECEASTASPKYRNSSMISVWEEEEEEEEEEEKEEDEE